MKTELILWHDAGKPDADTTVLCWGDDGFFTGYWDDEINGWISCESGGQVSGVTHWANPEGPGSVQQDNYIVFGTSLQREIDAGRCFVDLTTGVITFPVKEQEVIP